MGSPSELSRDILPPMAGRSQTCRYCETSFIPQPKKPGRIDECPVCLHERTRPVLPPNFPARYMARFPDRRKAFKESVKHLLSLGIDEAKVYEIIADGLNKAGTPI